MRVGFAAAGGGFLLPYHLGVLDQLQYHSFLTERTPLAGASAGAIAVGARACDIESWKILDDTIDISQSCQDMGGARGNLLPLIRDKLQRRVDEDRFQALLERPGDTIVSYLEIFPSVSSVHQSTFTERVDFVDALCHSSSFPFFASHWPFGWDFKTESPRLGENFPLKLPQLPRLVVDGFFAVPACRFGCPDFRLAEVLTVDRTVLITPFPAIRMNQDIREEDIICPPQEGLGIQQTINVLRSATTPSPAADHIAAYEAGQHDAERWCQNEVRRILTDEKVSIPKTTIPQRRRAPIHVPYWRQAPSIE